MGYQTCGYLACAGGGSRAVAQVGGPGTPTEEFLITPICASSTLHKRQPSDCTACLHHRKIVNVSTKGLGNGFVSTRDRTMEKPASGGSKEIRSCSGRISQGAERAKELAVTRTRRL